MLRQAAIFDLDHTLTLRDSLLLWLRELRGAGAVRLAFAGAVIAAPLVRPPGAEDVRGRVKALALAPLVRGLSVTEARVAAERIRFAVGWRREIVERLRWHRSRNHLIVIATGSPDLYVEDLMGSDLRPDAVLGTQLEVSADGILTGRLAGPNNTRTAKARRVAAWLAENGPFGETWGYGNAPHDRPMLALLTHAMIV